MVHQSFNLTDCSLGSNNLILKLNELGLYGMLKIQAYKHRHLREVDCWIGPARLPLLTVQVMSPATAAALKHILAPHVGPMYWFAPDSALATSLPTTTYDQSISLRCLCTYVNLERAFTHLHGSMLVWRCSGRSKFWMKPTGQCKWEEIDFYTKKYDTKIVVLFRRIPKMLNQFEKQMVI